MATEVGIKSSRVSPKFLHANSTSHTWPFSAVAELIDNAYDPDVSASEIWIDKRTIGSTECLTFVDNGNGMTPDRLHKMLSFGYCEKVAIGSVKPIGHYGNGFKSGSMRLGKDAMVFTRSQQTSSIGFLSQTYLTAVKAEAVIVPIVTWNIQTNGAMVRIINGSLDMNMKVILQYSPFKTEKDLILELKSLEKMKTGTSILISNLKCDNTDSLELDFISDPLDIRNPETPVIDLTTINRPIHAMQPAYRRSLREYCSILYFKPRMKIVLRGHKVKSKLISKSLSQTEVDVYKPTWLNKPVKLTFGFSNSKEPDSYGLMMYHKNRLILAYEKIGCQKQANDHGVGVIGVVEVNFLEPIHNKQEFNKTAQYVTFMQNVAGKLNDYYYEKSNSENPNGAKSVLQKLPDWTWAQCDNCLSWRRLPTGYNEKLPEKWYCYLNPDAAFNRCDIPEEPEDDDEALQPTYRKTYKKTLAEQSKRAKLTEANKLKDKEEALKLKEKMLQIKLKEISKKEEVLGEVSSSQDKVDRKPTVADLDRAKKCLQAYQSKLKAQEQTIKELENQKKQIENNSKAMVNMAESLRLSQLTSKNLVEKVQGIAGTSSSKVSSSSTTLRAPIKRKMSEKEGTSEQVVKVKKEGGGFISVSANFDDNAVVDLTLDEDNMDVTASPDIGSLPDLIENDSENKSVNSPNTCDSESTVFNTMNAEEESENLGNVNESKNETHEKEKEGNDTNVSDKADKLSHNRTEAIEKENEKEMDTENDTYTAITISDVKPAIEELDKDIAGGSKVGCSDSKEEKVFVPKGVQTVPTVIKFASPEEVDLLKLSPLEQTQMMLLKSRELDETKKDLIDTKTSLKSLQENISLLLKIIHEDFDYGDPENIEKVILDFIHVNGEQNDQPSTSGQ